MYNLHKYWFIIQHAKQPKGKVKSYNLEYKQITNYVQFNTIYQTKENHWKDSYVYV